MKRYVFNPFFLVIIALYGTITASVCAQSIVFNKGDELRPTASSFYPSIGNVKAADFTGNGMLDVVYTVDGEMGLCLNQGGRLLPPIIIDAFEYSAGITIADLTGNGLPDIAYALPDNPGVRPGSVNLLVNKGDLRFTRRVIDPDYLYPDSISAADINGNGFMDLVVSGKLPFGLGYFRLAWYENDGTGHFTMHSIDVIINGANDIDVGDINGNGFMDILYVGYEHFNLSWYENDGTGQFTRHLIDVPHGFTDWGTLQDMNQSGYADILLSVGNTEGLILLVNEDGGTTFTRKIVCDRQRHYRPPVAVDLDSDGHLDVLTSITDGDVFNLIWYKNDGDLNFTQHKIDSGDVGFSRFRALDISGNGRLDIVSGNASGGLAWWENQPHIGIGLSMPSHHFRPGDPCGLTASIYSHHPDYYGHLPMFVVLEAGGQFWFYPSWTPDIAWQSVAVAPGSRDITIIDPFHWPSGVGAASGIHFISLFTKPDLSALMGVINIFEFGWSPGG
jgi:hypothetical protein